MTASDILPLTYNITQSIWTMLGNAWVFDNLTLLQGLLGVFALGIVCDVIVYLRTGQWFHNDVSDFVQDDWRHYR